MLAQLKIKNFAIIDDLTIDFLEQMTVLTGETGSGKSIIIDAINLLTGERASNDMIRHDKDKAVIEGIFFYKNNKINQLLTEYGISSEENTLIVMREVAKNGRNICRLNGSLVTVNQLKQMGSYLVDVHVQHDTTRLVNVSNYLYLLDSFTDDSFVEEVTIYKNLHEKYQEILKKYNKLIKENKENQEKLDFYKFQQTEFEQSNISLTEYAELDEKRNVYTNYDKLYENLNKAYNNIIEQKVLENIYATSNHLSKISTINQKYIELSEQLLTIYYQLDDYTKVLAGELTTLDYDPKELDHIESRLNVYSTLKRKYKMDLESLIEYKNNLNEKINNIENYDKLLIELEKDLKEYFKQTLDQALKLRELRKNIALTIEKNLVKHLADLKLSNTSFNIIFNELNLDDVNYLNSNIFNDDGMDEVDFYVSFNIGEPQKPISKVASGGELSRFMLALKTILTMHQQLSTIVFDEIDTGVSGITANAIASKIKSISKNTQVLCITHLPQVAAIADNQLYISKLERENRTLTQVEWLNEDKRVIEIAKMIAGDDFNVYTIENAKNLLKKNE